MRVALAAAPRVHRVSGEDDGDDDAYPAEGLHRDGLQVRELWGARGRGSLERVSPGDRAAGERDQEPERKCRPGERRCSSGGRTHLQRLDHIAFEDVKVAINRSARRVLLASRHLREH